MIKEYKKTDLHIEEILTHRIDNDKYEFNVKLKDHLRTRWITESYLDKNHNDILDSYKKKNGIGTAKKLNGESELSDFSKLIALHCNDLLGIKIEIGCANEMPHTETRENCLEQLPSFETEICVLETSSIKLENYEITVEFPEDLCLISTENHLIDTPTTNISVTEDPVSDVISVPIMNGESCELQIENVISINVLDTTNKKNKFIDQDKHVQKEDDKHSNKEKQIKKISKDENNKTTAYNNNDMKKSSYANRKIKKAKHHIVETSKPEENKTAQSLLPVFDTSKTDRDTIDKLFYQLPVINKVIFDKNISNDELVEITIDLLTSMVDEGNINSLQAYMSSSQRKKLQYFIKNKPSLLVLAAEHNQVHMVAAFLSLGVNINAVDSRGRTALIRACYNENKALIELLVNNGAAMNIRPDDTNDVLVQCAENGKLESIKTLLNLGANFAQINSSHSLESFAKVYKLDEVYKIIESHNANLLKSVKETVLSQLGGNVKVAQIPILPIHVLSLYEISGETFEIKFSSEIPPVVPNKCNLLFLMTGIVLGTGLKCLNNNDSNKITSVKLNNVEQQSLAKGKYKVVTSFSPLRNDMNTLSITSENNKCRKIRLILVAYEVEITE